MLYILMFAHWVGDFVCQTRWMADNKSKCAKALTVHVAVYSSVILLAALMVSNWQSALIFAVANFGLHWGVDCFTSKVTKYFWEKEDTHKFFATIGLDQYIHFVCLALTSQFIL